MSQQIFRVFEAFTDAIQDADMRVILCRRERSLWSIRHLHVDSVHIQQGSDGCGNIAEGATRRDGWTFVWKTEGGMYLGNGELLTRDSVFVLSPGAEFRLACQSPHDWMSVFLPASFLFSSADIARIRPSPLGHVVHPGGALAGGLRATVEGFLAAADAAPSVTTELASVDSFREELCRIAQQIVLEPVLPMEAERRSWEFHQLMLQVVELIEQWPHKSPSVAQLARKLDISERTLRSAFAENLGVSPYQYLVSRRMHHARQLLLKSDPDELTVREAAAKVGFWDYGRFAGRYRCLFGELPSETLRRKRSHT